MNIKFLKVFCDVVGQRSFSRAADANGISQSGASQIVHQLEDHLGVKLIDRSKRPFVLTPEGEVYYEGSRKVVQRYEALEEQVRTLHAEVSGRVSVASIYSVGLSHMNRIVQKFLTKHPKANVRIQYQHPDRVYELVETDQVDLGLVSYPRPSRNIRATLWREEPMLVVVAPNHALAGRSSVMLGDLADLDMVGFDGNLEIRHEIDRVLSSAGVAVQVAMEFDNTETMKRAVEINAGFALLPAPTVDREVEAGSLRAIPLSDTRITRPVGIIQRKGKELGQTARRFLQLLQEHSNAPPTDGDVASGGAPVGSISVGSMSVGSMSVGSAASETPSDIRVDDSLACLVNEVPGVGPSDSTCPEELLGDDRSSSAARGECAELPHACVP